MEVKISEVKRTDASPKLFRSSGGGKEAGLIAEGRRKFGNGLCNGCSGCNGCQSDGRRKKIDVKKEEGRSNNSKGFSN
ncbi:hypothetical protein QT971_02445 [Microcoleus sp. herbarium19]|uniref:hypothetical protein n=1 Tax=Microcoleus sp. herbarium13 TaxID=3055438 RepID=UPI002FD0D65C